MALYEMRTYTLYVGKMAEAQKLYTELGFPALKKGGHDKNLVVYFVADTGMINQLVHIWKFKYWLRRYSGGAPRDVRVLGGTPVGRIMCVKDARERAYDAACQALARRLASHDAAIYRAK